MEDKRLLADRRLAIEYTPNLSGQHILLTGATDGIGAALARTLAASGACLTILARSAKKAHRLIGELNKATKNISHRYLYCDLSCIKSCEDAVLVLLRMGVKFKFIFANAGVVGNNEDTNVLGVNNILYQPYWALYSSEAFTKTWPNAALRACHSAKFGSALFSRA